MTNQEKPIVRYEDAAERRDGLSGWVCKNGHFHGDDEHIARWCAATEIPCPDCGGRNPNKSYSVCEACRRKRADERWFKSYAEKAVPWDGVTPLYSDASDRYFWDDGDLGDHIGDPPELSVDDLRLILCEPNKGRSFDMADWLSDDLPEDSNLDTTEIDRIVNDWIAAHAPYSWCPSGPPVTVESVRSVLGIPEPQREPTGS